MNSSQVGGAAEAAIRRWLEGFVVGLNLCPFARPLLGRESLRIALCESGADADLRLAFLQELDLLQRTSEEQVATTLLAFPVALQDFESYLVFLDECQELLQSAGLEGVVQLASFHPQYLFAAEAADGASHYSNRSPYPMIHFLREEMLSRVLDDGADPELIPAKNIETLQGIGVQELALRWQALFDGVKTAG
jgi:hypothetical protein